MSMTDPIADMLTRIRNAGQARHEAVVIPHSRVKEQIAKILAESGYVGDVEVEGEGKDKSLVFSLIYTPKGEPKIIGLERVSKPGRRIYVGYQDLKPVRSGMGMSILSTPTGVMSDAVARSKQVGGEILMNVW